jgi:pimeloyl-ACP methyl ester carboxylesterase
MELFFKTFGNQGEPLIILHGLYGSSDNWQTIAKQLAETYRVYIPDMRNHGRSPHSPEHSYKAMAEDIAELLNKLQLNKAIIIGHSMGGKTAMQFALDYPDKVEKLVVVDISPRSYLSLTEPEKQVSEHMNILSGLISIDPLLLKSRQQAEEELAVYVTDAPTRHFLLKNLVHRDNHFEWTINIAGLRRNLPNVMGGIVSDSTLDKPVLFIKGERSDYLQASDEKIIKSFFPKAEMATIFDAGHWIHAEQPKQFLAVLLNFLKEENVNL